MSGKIKLMKNVGIPPVRVPDFPGHGHNSLPLFDPVSTPSQTKERDADEKDDE
jgi:hypothetical protein